MTRKKFIAFFYVMILLAGGWLAANPAVESHFPAGEMLVGKPARWTISLQHGYFETYQIVPQPCAGASIALVKTETREQGKDLRTTFSLEIAPTALSIPDIPQAVLVGSNGERLSVSGQRCFVHVISGTSTDLKNPHLPPFNTPGARGMGRIVGALAVTALILAVFIFFRWWQTPKQKLRRQVAGIQAAMKSGTKPKSEVLLGVFRSSFLWKSDVAALSAAELQGKAANRELTAIALSIASLEDNRYSGGAQRPERKTIVEGLSAAMTLVDGK